MAVAVWRQSDMSDSKLSPLRPPLLLVGEVNLGQKEKINSRFIASMALSMPFTTLVKFPVTCCIVMAVSTRLATALIRLARPMMFRDSPSLRIALAACFRAPSLLPWWSAYIQVH